jgi:hypothetical protein
VASDYGTPSAQLDTKMTPLLAMMIKPGEEIVAGSNERFRVLDVVPFEEEDESPFVGMLEVDAAEARTTPTWRRGRTPVVMGTVGHHPNRGRDGPPACTRAPVT